jgi:hypothetical protein
MNKQDNQQQISHGTSPITLRAHPPERQSSSVVVASPSCCCCCCLHSLGGLIGAGIGSAGSRGRSAVGVYWLVLFLLAVVTETGSILLLFVEETKSGVTVMGSQFESGIGAGLLILIMAAPAVQLAASIVAAIVVAIDWGPTFVDDQNARLGAIGRITLGTVIGTGIGVLFMLGCCGMGRFWF